MAKVIIVGSEKGGAGKSTLINAMTAANENILVVDTDPQGDLFKLLGKSRAAAVPIATRDDDDLGEAVAEVIEKVEQAANKLPDDAVVILNTAGGILTHLNPSAELIAEALAEIDPEWAVLFLVSRDDAKVPKLFSFAPTKTALWAAKEAPAPEKWEGPVIPKLNKVGARALQEAPAADILSGDAGVPMLARVAVRKFCEFAEEVAQ